MPFKHGRGIMFFLFTIGKEGSNQVEEHKVKKVMKLKDKKKEV
jgi:hypothetical protein